MIVIVAPITSVNAAILFTDRQSFMAATGAADFPLPQLGARDFPTTIGDLTFSSDNRMHFGHWSTLLTGNDLAISDSENFNVSFNTDVYGFGFAIHEPTGTGEIDGCNTSCVEIDV